MSGIHVRRMTSADAAAVAALCAQLGYSASAPEVSRRLASLGREGEDALYVAESRDGEVIGWVHAHASRLLQAAPCAQVGGLVVDARYRG